METAAVEKVWLSYPEAEERTGLSSTTLWRALRTGELRASGRGRGIRFHRDELDRYMTSRN
jgi:excisionase family DNA binding protein